jgi:lincosamide and streptogramin A transport system ATP-binding/permease protein
MSLINIQNLTFSYEGSYDNIFEDVSFQIDTDWKLGFIGRNGRGKTTFLKLLLGEYEYSGTISASVDFEYFPYIVTDEDKNTIDALTEIHPDFLYWQLQRELSLLEVDENVLYRPFSTLSKGEQTKVLLSILFLKENSFLLIDEPTNHLDMKGRQLVSRYLKSKKGFILVSHDRAFLDGCVEHILSINKTNIEIQKGNFSSWLENKERQDKYEIAEHEKLKKEIKRLKEAAREKAERANKFEREKVGADPRKIDNTVGRRPYLAAKSKKMMKRAKAIESRYESSIEEKSKLLKNIESAEELKIHRLDYHSNRLISLRDITVSYGENTVCSGITFDIEKGDRLALQGRNGSGKSSIIKMIMGESIPHTGTFEKGSNIIISYVPQDSSFLKAACLTLQQNTASTRASLRQSSESWIFSRSQFDKNMQDFSGGQKKKVLIAKSLCEKAHLYIWDEPLNFVDVISRMQIEELLLSFNPTILFVEHDRVFCEKIANKTVTL